MTGKKLFLVICLFVLLVHLVEASATSRKKKENDFTFIGDDEDLMFGDEGSGDDVDNIDNEIPPFPPLRTTVRSRWPTRRPWPPARPTAPPSTPCRAGTRRCHATSPCYPTSRPCPQSPAPRPCQSSPCKTRPCQSSPCPAPAPPAPRPCQSRPCTTKSCNPCPAPLPEVPEPLPCQSRPCKTKSCKPCRAPLPELELPEPCQTRSCKTKSCNPCPAPILPPMPPAPRPCRTSRCRIPRRPRCTSKRTCRPKLPKLPPITLPSTYIPAKVCGQSYYCRQGYQGPCKSNEILTKTPSIYSYSRPVTTTVSQSCPSRPVGCFIKNPFELSVQKPTTGYCTVRNIQQPCSGYPSTYRYSRSSKQCYPTLQIGKPSRPVSSPCPVTQIFVPVDKYFGHCRCSQPNYVRCKNTNRCYPAYSQGSCHTGQWLVPSGNTGLSTCQRSPCPTLADGRHIYWSGKGHHYGRPGCYKSHTQGPCRPGYRFVIDDMMLGSSHCTSNRKSTNPLMKDWYLYYQ